MRNQRYNNVPKNNKPNKTPITIPAFAPAEIPVATDGLRCGEVVLVLALVVLEPPLFFTVVDAGAVVDKTVVTVVTTVLEPLGKMDAEVIILVISLVEDLGEELVALLEAAAMTPEAFCCPQVTSKQGACAEALLGTLSIQFTIH